LFIVAAYHEDAFRKNKAEAIRWYRRAQAAGHPGAAAALEGFARDDPPSP
jgi:TPR repeat protein